MLNYFAMTCDDLAESPSLHVAEEQMVTTWRVSCNLQESSIDTEQPSGACWSPETGAAHGAMHQVAPSGYRVDMVTWV